jgi:hypothetical protein
MPNIFPFSDGSDFTSDDVNREGPVFYSFLLTSQYSEI